MPPTPIARRRFLSQLGLAAAALPIASQSWGRRVLAGPSSAPRRLVLWPGMNGADPMHFWPSGGGLSLVTEPLAPWADRVTFVRGLDVAGSDNHFAVRSIFTGQPVSSYDSADPAVHSLDQLVAAENRASITSLHLGVRPADSYDFYQLYGRSTLFFTPAGPVDYEANPVAAFDRYLASDAAPAPTPTGPTFDADAEALRIATEEIDELAPRLRGLASEEEKLAQHRAAIARLRPMEGGGEIPPMRVSCDAAPIASVESLRAELGGEPRAAYRDALFERVFDAQVDVAARALVCGLTRVATIQAGSADGNVVVPVEGGHPHHNTSHGDQALFARMQRWYVSKMARLLTALDVPDPLDPSGGTVLDNTCILFMSECLPSSHSSADVPCFFVGGAGGRLRTGSVVNADGATNRHLLKSMCRAFDVGDELSGHFGSDEIRAVRS